MKSIILDTNVYGWYLDYTEKGARTSEAANSFSLLSKIFKNKDKMQVFGTETIEKEIKKARRSELTNLFYSTINGIIKNSKRIIELSDKYLEECKKENLRFVDLNDCEIVAAAAAAGVKALVTENRKSLNIPRVKNVFGKINAMKNLRSIEIKSCKEAIDYVF